MTMPVPFQMHGGLSKESPLARFALCKLQETDRAMTKTFEAISEAVRSPKPPFRKIDNQPKKPLKHRYERRKIKEYLHLGDWQTEEAT
jgi:hypothetical protein